MAIPDSLGEILPGSARRFGDRTALVFEGRRFSFAGLDALSASFARALRHIGVNPGDRVTLYSGNCWEWIVAYYGVLRAGAVINPVNVMLTPDEVRYVVQDCKARVIVAAADKAQAIIGMKAEHAVDEIIAFGPDIPEGAASFAELLKRFEGAFGVEERKPEDLSTICYTSGTTGHPKGAMLSHRTVVLNTAMTSLMHMRVAGETVVTALPCAHVYGNVIMNAAMLYGMTLVLHRTFDAGAVLESIQAERATLFEGVPTMYMYLLEYAGLDACDLSSLTRCTVGGQTMPVPKMEEVEARFGCPLVELWGMTELGGLGTTHPLYGPVVHGSIGIVLPYMEARVAGFEGDAPLPPGEHGELMMRGPLVMQGYYGNEQATREAITGDGWLHTGDVAWRDEAGRYFIVDRRKDMIITAGFNVYPAEIERVLAGHPKVAMVAVGSRPDPVKGEIARAYVVPKSGTSPTAEEIIAFCRERLAAYKVPREVQFVSDLPRTSTGKIMRRELRKLCDAESEMTA